MHNSFSGQGVLQVAFWAQSDIFANSEFTHTASECPCYFKEGSCFYPVKQEKEESIKPTKNGC